jgi:hypothetical protein
VLALKHQGGIKHFAQCLVRLLRIEHVKEVGGDRKLWIGGDGLLAIAQPMERGDDGGVLGRQPDGLAAIGLAVVARQVRVQGAQGADGRAEGVHHLRLGRQGFQQSHHMGRKSHRCSELLLKLGELGAIGKLFVPEQMSSFLKADLANQIGDLIAAINQTARVTVDEADGARRGDDSLKTSGFGGGGGWGLGRRFTHGNSLTHGTPNQFR